MTYATSSHAVFHHRYHIVWITKYRYKVLTRPMKERVREITRQICAQMGVRIIEGVLSSDHVHLFVEIPPKHSVSDFMRRVKGCTSRKLQQEFPHLKKRYWGRRFWARGYFSTTSGNVTNELIQNYILKHLEGNEPTDGSR
jgi:putative transposase